MVFRLYASGLGVQAAYGSLRQWINAAAVAAAFTIVCLTAFGALAQSAARVSLLVVGDSLTAGYGLSRNDGFPAQLERALSARGLSVQVRDGGVSGDTSTGGRSRLGWMLGSGPAQPDAVPNAVIVQLGANDALRGIDPELTYGNLSAILSDLARRGLPVLLAGMKAPPNLGEDYRRRFDAIYPRLAEEHGVPLYPFFLDGVAAVPTLNQPDGMHPNARGVAEIVRRITPAAVALVEQAAGRAPVRAGP